VSVVRTFIAVECSEGVRSRAVSLIERLRPAQAKVSWVLPDNMHWTLKFLGDVDMTRTADICQQVTDAVAGIEPFEVAAAGAGAFPTVERPRTLWIGMGEGEDEMANLSQRIDEALAGIGFSPDSRRYKAHLTIGRVRGGQNIAELGRLVAKQSAFEGGQTRWSFFPADWSAAGPSTKPSAARR